MLCLSIFTCINGVDSKNTKHWHLIETFLANNYKSEVYEKYISGLAMRTK